MLSLKLLNKNSIQHSTTQKNHPLLRSGFFVLYDNEDMLDCSCTLAEFIFAANQA